MKTRTKKSLKASLTLMFALVMLFGFVPISAAAEDEYPVVAFAGGSWAMWNLILCIAGAALAFFMSIGALVTKKQESETVHANNAAGKGKCGRLVLIIASLLLAIAGIILFLLTQDMRHTMVTADWWTVAHVILFASGILSYVFVCKKEKD